MRSRSRTAAVCALAALATACGPSEGEGTVIAAGSERVYVDCRGSGTPAVVLVHGIGDRADSSAWIDVQDGLADDRRVCRYDRPGTGESPPPDERGRDGDDLVAELEDVAAHADPDGRTLVVGHSFGGYPALLYADRNPDVMAGLVLVDAVDPGLGLRAATGADTWSAVPQAEEALDLARVESRVGEVSSLGDLPLVVLSRGRGATAAWERGQDALAALSTAGVQRVAAETGHQIPTQDPGAVLSAVRDLPAR